MSVAAAMKMAGKRAKLKARQAFALDALAARPRILTRILTRVRVSGWIGIPDEA
jgi:hypothetical protein